MSGTSVPTDPRGQGAGDRQLVRIGSFTGMVGGPVSLAVAFLHPSESVSGSDFTTEHVNEIAGDAPWLAGHFGNGVAALLGLCALAAIAEAIHGPGRAWARLARLVAVAAVGLILVTTAVDGFAIRRVAEEFVAASPEPGSPYYLAVQGFEDFQLSLFSMVVFTFFGATQLLYGLATWYSGNYPRWLGGMAVVFGAVGMGVGAYQLLFEISTASIAIFVVTWNVFVLWTLAMSILTWRGSGRPPA